MTRPTFKPSLQDQRRASLAAQQAMAHDGMSDAAKRHLAEFAATVKPKQIRAKSGGDGRRLESDIQREIIKFLLQHPMVVMVERINSGAVYGEQGNFIRFHTVMLPKCYQKFGAVRVVDLNVMLHDGRRMAIECKRDGWSRPTDQREREQGNYLSLIRSRGGIGIFAASVEDVRVALVANGY